MTGKINEDDIERRDVERLLTAYFDNELEPAQRAEVEAMLGENPKWSGLLDQWRESGDSLRQLPLYSLGDEFSAGVRSKIDAILSSKPSRPAVVASSFDSQKAGLGGIIALAAMLLLTLFVFPRLMGNGADRHAVVVVEDVDRESVAPEEEPPKVKAAPIIAPRNSSLSRKINRSPSVDVASGQPKGIEQVLLIQNVTLSDLEAVLNRHAIRIVDLKGKTAAEAHFISQTKQGVEAVHVVSQRRSMQRAINEIADKGSVIVTAFAIPGQLGTRGIGSSKIASNDDASALQLQPVELSGAAATSREIENLDRWFGLSDDVDDTKSVECLLLIQPARAND